MDSVEEKIKKVISAHMNIPVSKLDNSARIRQDLGADSLDTVSLLFTLEDSLGHRISDEDAENLKTIQNVIDYFKLKQQV